MGMHIIGYHNVVHLICIESSTLRLVIKAMAWVTIIHPYTPKSTLPTTTVVVL